MKKNVSSAVELRSSDQKKKKTQLSMDLGSVKESNQDWVRKFVLAGLSETNRLWLSEYFPCQEDQHYI